MKELNADILITGGGTGGCAAAIAACSAGRSVIMTEGSDWIGGQFTSQATPPDEHGWIEQFGCTENYRRFRNKVRDYYRKNYPLTDVARTDKFLNPGNGWVSPLCAEPRVFMAVLNDLLAEFVANGTLQILLRTVPAAADTDGDLVKAVAFESLDSNDETIVTAKYFIDATELGDLLPLTKTEFVTGAESRSETGEPHAKPKRQPSNSQAFSMCFAMSYRDGEDHTIAKPTKYDFWRNFIPDLDPPWSGPLLSLTGLSPRTLEPVLYNFQPNHEPNVAFAGLWTYRRILHIENFTPGAFDSDVTLVNYPQIDYMLGDLCNATSPEKAKMIDDAKQQSLSFFYYLQTDLGFKGLKLRPDITDTEDGLAKTPYVRESRRIKAEFTVTEDHVATASRPNEKFAQEFRDSVGIGYYRIDLHPTVGGDNYLDVEALPFQIPLGALIPQRCENLIAGCKNIGTTHITNGCYRLHPVEWNIGEAAGNLASFSIESNLSPKQVRGREKHLADFQSRLVEKGFELAWPSNLALSEGDPHRHAL